MDEDCLIELSIDYLNSLINYLKCTSRESTVWAQNYLYNHLKNQLAHCTEGDISDACRTKIYGPLSKNGKFENCTFIGITGPNDYSLFLFTIEETASELLECFKNTKRINWNSSFFYIYMQSYYSKEIDKILNDKGHFKKKYYTENVYYLSKENVQNFNIEIPKEICIRPLALQDSELINNNWPYKYNKSLQLIESLIRLNGGTGIYDVKNEELVTWILTNQYHCPGFLHTIKTYRRKGYGSLILKIECKRIVDNDQQDICLLIARENNASRAMVEKLGFKNVQELTCIDLTKMN